MYYYYFNLNKPLNFLDDNSFIVNYIFKIIGINNKIKHFPNKLKILYVYYISFEQLEGLHNDGKWSKANDELINDIEYFTNLSDSYKKFDSLKEVLIDFPELMLV